MRRSIIIVNALLWLACSGDTENASTAPEGPDTVTEDSASIDSQTAPEDTISVDTTAPPTDTEPPPLADAAPPPPDSRPPAPDTGPINLCSSPSNAPPCDDGNACNGVESCDPDTGDCISGTPPPIDDGVDCTQDSCDPALGPVHTPNDGLCSSAGPCTTTSCDSVAGCQTVETTPCCGNGAIETGEACDDSNQEPGDGCSPSCTLTSPCDSGCNNTSECPGGLVCEGKPSNVPGAYGQCVDISPVPGEDDACSLDNPCGPNLACLGAYSYDNPWCVQGWMAKTFYSAETVPIPDGDAQGVTTHIVACGLADVPVDVVATLQIDHPNPSDLVVTLYDPNGSPEDPGSGASSVLWDQVPDGPATVVAGFPGDDLVNGLWKLHVKDTVSGQTGTLKGWSVYLLSRPD